MSLSNSLQTVTLGIGAIGQFVKANWLLVAAVAVALTVGIGWGVDAYKTRAIIRDYENDKKATAKIVSEKDDIIIAKNKEIAMDAVKYAEKEKQLAVANDRMERLTDDLEKARDAVRVADTANERARAVRSINGTRAELCAILARQGRPCD